MHRFTSELQRVSRIFCPYFYVDKDTYCNNIFTIKGQKKVTSILVKKKLSNIICLFSGIKPSNFYKQSPHQVVHGLPN